LLFRLGVAPHATYLFKHALVQDAAYGTLLREAKRALHARISETLESQFAEIAERQPELLARHCTEADLIEKAVGLWGKAGQQSLERSALVEAVEQFTRALSQIATMQMTPALRRERINLRAALITPLTSGYLRASIIACPPRDNARRHRQKSRWKFRARVRARQRAPSLPRPSVVSAGPGHELPIAALVAVVAIEVKPPHCLDIPRCDEVADGKQRLASGRQFRHRGVPASD
jgi:hypothetical protein